MFNFFKFLVTKIMRNGYDLEESETRGLVLTLYGLPVLSFQYSNFLKPCTVSFLYYHLDLEDFNSWIYFSIPLIGTFKIGKNTNDTTGGITGFEIGLLRGYISYRKKKKGKYILTGTIKREWDVKRLFEPRTQDMVTFDKEYKNALDGDRDIVTSGFFYKIRFTPFIRVKAVIAIIDNEHAIEHKAYSQLMLRTFSKRRTATLVERVVKTSINNIIAVQ